MQHIFSLQAGNATSADLSGARIHSGALSLPFPDANLKYNPAADNKDHTVCVAIAVNATLEGASHGRMKPQHIDIKLLMAGGRFD